MVSPPPGVSSAVRVPPIASVRPRARARPSPTPVVLSRSPSRWKGWKIRSRSSAATPGPRSMTRISTRPACALAASAGGPAGRAVPQGVGEQVGQDPFEERGVGDDLRQGLGDVDGRRRAHRARGRRAGAGRARPARPAAALTASAPACRRLMSSRFSISRVSWSSDSSAVASSSARSSSVHRTVRLRRLVTAALAEASGPRRSWLTAASRAVRIRSASAISPASAACSASSCRSRTTAAWAPNAASTRWSSARSGRPSPASISVPVSGTCTGAAGAGGGVAGVGDHLPRGLGLVGRRAASRLTALRPKVSRARSSSAGSAVSPAQHAAGEGGEGGGLGGGVRGLAAAAGHPLDQHGHEDRDRDEDQQREGVVPLGDRERVGAAG